MASIWRRHILAFILLCSLAAGGCGVVIVAGLGALGGYAISPNTVEGIVGYENEELFESAVDILSIMGTVSVQLKSSGHIEAVTSGTRVTVDIIPVSKSTTKLRVKAKRWIFPKMAVAQDVYMKIVRRLQE